MYSNGSNWSVNAIMAAETLIVELRVPRQSVILLQGLLEGEDGLAVMRCMDASHECQQLWSTPEQREELYAWLQGLPKSMQVEFKREWIWEAQVST